MAAKIPAFTKEDMEIDESSGFPKAYAKLCFANLYSNGPPRAFIPYILEPQEALHAKDLNRLFPVVDPDAQPSVNPRGFVDLLWKQLDHLGNAGFDPALFRVDPFGNVLYLHADSASPLAWDIDHWFPCSRGGKTLPSNLRLLQWQVCKKKRSNKLDFLIPWWDLQLGISVNQFLSIFASRNSDFRNRAFSFLFADGGSEELTTLQTVESHSFPQHFIETKQKVGLAPAAVVTSQRSNDTSILKPLDFNSCSRHNSILPASRISEDNAHKENERPDTENYTTNPYLSIARARDSFKQQEELKKKQGEISELDNELQTLMQKNEEERLALQELEEVLIKRRRRVEKCRRLAEAQASYKTLLEKMIRDAMHQSVVYKEQLRLNQAATNTLMARLEAQRATCDNSEAQLRRKFKEKDEIEKQIRPFWQEQARKRSCTEDAHFFEKHEASVRPWNPLKKELRVFLEEEHKASEAGTSHDEEEEEESKSIAVTDNLKKIQFKQKLPLNYEFKGLTIRDDVPIKKHEKEEDEQRKEVGKGNVEKWLHIMLENAKEGSSSSREIVEERNLVELPKDIRHLKLKPRVEESYNETKQDKQPMTARSSFGADSRKGESSRGFRSFPSSPSMILGMRRGVDCMRMKPKVVSDCDEEEEGNLDLVNTSRIIRNSSKAMKKKSMNN